MHVMLYIEEITQNYIYVAMLGILSLLLLMSYHYITRLIGFTCLSIYVILPLVNETPHLSNIDISPF